MDTATAPHEPTRPLPPGHLITTTAAAEYLGVSGDVVRRYIRDKVIHPDHVINRGRNNQRIQRHAVLALAGQDETQ